ncbi:hypothetical protein [Granulicella sp. dw_53]|uniref:hypothetical protein n=1 Tax=Granulicella sp. dw_53 TaxID=2719792 RepID=UPI001BD64892|nr:hypothetical protein [Granulicella sp. dw_53]
MADQLYLSLWFPNFRFEALPAALTSVLRQFALVSGNPEAKRVVAATVYPINFTESPTYQRIYVNDDRSEDTSDSIIENAVAEATEHLHDDMAVEFEMQWNLWSPELGAIASRRNQSLPDIDLDSETGEESADAQLDPLWKLRPTTVRVLGFGPQFDDAGFEQNGHIRVDFGLDTPWVMDDTLEDEALDELAQKRIQQNIEMLLAFTLSVEKHCGISSRLLWTESGEPLAEKLIARLQRLN